MYQRINNESIKSYRERQSLARAAPSSEMESLWVRELCEVLDLDVEDMNIDNPIFSMGVTSVDLIRLKRNIEKQLAGKRHSNDGATDQSHNPSSR